MNATSETPVDPRLAMLLTRDRGVLSHDEEAAIRELTAERDVLVKRVAEVEAERDGAYRERAHLVALLAAQHQSWLTYSETHPEVDDDWRIAYVNLPTGQASWHIAPCDLDLFGHVGHYTGDDGQDMWDGHSTKEKYRRIAEYTAVQAAASNAKAGAR